MNKIFKSSVPQSSEACPPLYQKRGILARERKEHDSTKFKLLCWYEKKNAMEFYTQHEIDGNKNRHYHDSVDFFMGSGNQYITRHDIAFEKLVDHVKKYRDRIFVAWLFMNDFGNNAQYLIGKYNRFKHESFLVQPEFTHYEKLIVAEKIIHDEKNPEQFEIIEKQFNLNHVFATGLTAAPLEIYELKQLKTV
jgi:hypothetical protein